MKLTVRCLVVFLGLVLAMFFMAPASHGDPRATGLLGMFALAALAVTVLVAVLELLGLMGRTLEWLAGWKR